MGKILLGLDIETTGLDFEKDYVTEIGVAIVDTDDPKPLLLKSDFVKIPHDVEISDDIYQLTKIKKRHLEAGEHIETVLENLDAWITYFGVDALVAHNGTSFDLPFLKAKAEGSGILFSERLLFLNKPLIDTALDVEYPADCKNRNLTYLAAYHGFLNPFPHAALSDVQTMMRVLSNYDIEPIYEQALTPWKIVQANVSYHNRDLAKARGYAWENIGSLNFPKSWVKRIREGALEKERSEAPFAVSIIG